MNKTTKYQPGAANCASIDKSSEDWILIVTKELSHSPTLVWEALTNPEILKKWAPFDANNSLGIVGNKVKLTTIDAVGMGESETTVSKAAPPRLLEYQWGDFDMRWELEPTEKGTQLILRTKIARPYIAMGAAGWHICLDGLGLTLDGTDAPRMVGSSLLKDEGWQRLHKDYSQQFGIKS